METDRLNCADTDKIDCIRCAHPQRHTSGAQISASRSPVKKNKTSYRKNGVICRYFQEGTLQYPTHHKTAGQFYKHACENCDGTHTTKSCNRKNVAKKLSGHCSNAVGQTVGNFVYSSRYVYNSNLHESRLLEIC